MSDALDACPRSLVSHWTWTRLGLIIIPEDNPASPNSLIAHQRDIHQECFEWSNHQAQSSMDRNDLAYEEVVSVVCMSPRPAMHRKISLRSILASYGSPAPIPKITQCSESSNAMILVLSLHNASRNIEVVPYSFFWPVWWSIRYPTLGRGGQSG